MKTKDTTPQKEKKADCPHAGHRARLRYKWEKGSYFEKHEFLELLLFFSIPRSNTNEIAHALLDRFGSIQGILNADPKELRSVPGVGKNTVFFMSVLSALISHYNEEQIDKDILFSSQEELSAYVKTLYVGDSTEKVYILFFDSAGRLKSVERVGEGFSSLSELSLQKINKLAVQSDAAAAVLTHNHPSGLSRPSNKDFQTNKRIAEALRLLGIVLIDHIVVSGNESLSMMRK